MRSLNMHMTVSLNSLAIGSMLYSKESQIGRELIDCEIRKVEGLEDFKSKRLGLMQLEMKGIKDEKKGD